MRPRPLLVLLALCVLVVLPAGAASAHPLGNFTVNRYDGLVVAEGRLRVEHVEDLAEIPATQAGPDLKRLGPGRWARQRCAQAAEGSELTVDGHRTALTAVGGTARTRPGQAGLNTLRVECRLTAALPRGGVVALRFRGAGATGGPGWREITARGDRMTLTAADVPRTSVTHELTVYPRDLLSSPVHTTTATLRARAGGPALARERQDAPGAAVLPRGADRWTRALDGLVARHDLTVGFAALALLVAVGLGALHALAPGHGKTLMAATAAARGGRSRLRDVLPLAASVTVTHTLGVVALGLLVTAGSAATPSVIAWLGIASGALVLLAGATLVRRAWRNRTPAGAGADAHAHSHPHPHSHSHSHSHSHQGLGERPLALAGARHEAGRAGHGHPHRHPAPSGRPGPHGDGGVVHTHGGHTHSHPTAPTLRGTLLLGFAGGLVPSPSAVVVLVGATALGKAWFGLLLVVAYGAGLALTLTAAGFAVVRLGSGANRILERRPRWGTHPLTMLVSRTLPLGSAVLVLALGVGLVLKGAAAAVG